ncbi:MAG: hypothetical protein WAW13_00780 [Minisyncoccia bacterium]
MEQRAPMHATPVEYRVSLVPSLPAQAFEEIEVLLGILKGVAHGVQIDIVDGQFAPHVSWPFTEDDVVHALEKLSVYTDFEIEMDCMCMNPEMYLDTFVRLGAKRVVIHAGSTENYEACINHARKNGYRIGIGIKNSISPTLRDELVSKFDFVQVMGIENIGVQGQPFDMRTLDTIAALRSTFLGLEIAVDGAVNAETIPKLFAAGVNRFAPGSAIAKAEDPLHAYKQLAHMVGL